jgi:hypothetical protein
MRANQIARKFDEIVEFSGCARYIDTPVHPGGLGSRSGTEALGCAEVDCRKAAPKEEQIGKTCESNCRRQPER